MPLQPIPAIGRLFSSRRMVIPPATPDDDEKDSPRAHLLNCAREEVTHGSDQAVAGKLVEPASSLWASTEASRSDKAL